METTTARQPHTAHLDYTISPQTLGIFQTHFPDHPTVRTALEEARAHRINYGTLAGLAALADQTHLPDLTRAVLEIFTAMSSRSAVQPSTRVARVLAVMQN